MTNAHVDFCGEIHPVVDGTPLVIGREGDLALDDNPYLHRRFLELSRHDGLLWLTNVGTQISATVADQDGLVQTWVAPGARVPIVFPKTIVWFTAGAMTYEFDIIVEDPPFAPVGDQVSNSGSTTTIGRVSFTPDQRLLILALAEEILRRGNRGQGSIPSSVSAAARLGWTTTKFNRKLDNVCEKLTKLGVRGLQGSAERLASNRRIRLVEYALAARLVTVDDLAYLDAIDHVAE